MKLQNGSSRKLRYGSVSLAITAGVVCAVLLLNVLVSALFSKNLWWIDLTTEPLYTLSDETTFLLGKTLEGVDAERDEPVQVDIIFCADPDLLISSDRTRSVYYTALNLQKAFPENIRVSTRDVWNNPSSVDAFRTNAYSSIYPSYVIVASGSEFRVYNNDAFYSYYSDDTVNPFAYNGEKTFVKGIIAVTHAEAPICALTVNHGEPFATEAGRAEYSELLRVIEGSGYEIVYLDLLRDPIPENCRLIVTFDPQTDFVSNYLDGGESELLKLDAFLDNAYSFMVFADADTPKLANLEEYLEEWGIVFGRYERTTPTLLKDPTSALDPEGDRIIGQFETEGVGGELTQDMREHTAPPKVVFGNATTISYSHSYEQTYVLADEKYEIGAFTYGVYRSNGVLRNIYDIFRTTDQAFAVPHADGNVLTDAGGEPIRLTNSPFRLMTITEEERLVGEGTGYNNARLSSYVCAFGSTEFASNASLSSSAYANTDVLLSTLRTVGKEVTPVGLDFKELYDAEIDEDYNPQASAVMQTVLLAALPAVVALTSGCVVLTRRKLRK